MEGLGRISPWPLVPVEWPQGLLGKLRPDLHPMFEVSLRASGRLSHITPFNLVIW